MLLFLYFEIPVKPTLIMAVMIDMPADDYIPFLPLSLLVATDLVMSDKVDKNNGKSHKPKKKSVWEKELKAYAYGQRFPRAPTVSGQPEYFRKMKLIDKCPMKMLCQNQQTITTSLSKTERTETAKCICGYHKVSLYRNSLCIV